MFINSKQPIHHRLLKRPWLRKRNSHVPRSLRSITRAKRGRDEQGDREDSVPSQNFFRKNSGKVLTEQNANVFLEIFPLAGSGSLKFTLCDWLGPPINIFQVNTGEPSGSPNK